MGLNELSVINRKNELMDPRESMFREIPLVLYSAADDSRYVFESELNDGINVTAFESDQLYDHNEFIDADYDDEISESDRSYLTVAIASGFLTGVLGSFNFADAVPEKVGEWTDKDWKKIIIPLAKVAGYKKSDYRGAVEYLKNRIISYVDEELKKEVQEGLNKILNSLSSHPSIAGFVFSIYSQYSEKKFSFNDGSITSEDVPEYYAIGRNMPEKITYGFLYWIFYLALDKVASKRLILEDIGLCKPIVNALKELYKLPIFQNIQNDPFEAEKLYSKWIRKIFEKSEYENEDGKRVPFDLQEVMNSFAKNVTESGFSIIANECIVRSFYFIKKLKEEIISEKIQYFNELDRIDAKKILPFNNRLVTRMITVSSGCFVSANLVCAVGKTIKDGHYNSAGEFATALLTEVNIYGIGRFIFACVADSKYWGEDITISLQRKASSQKNADEKIINDMFSNDSFKILLLDSAQTRILYSLESIVVLKDIEQTKKEKDKASKLAWYELWQSRIASGMGLEASDYFVNDEKEIYELLNSAEQTEDFLHSFYLVLMELVVFNPYHPLGTRKDKEFKKLDMTDYDYISDLFVRKQTIASQAEVDSIRKTYKKYKGALDGTTQGKIIATGVTIGSAVISGGIAMAFAPGIAVMIAGDAVVGLHGAALVSAGLAYVGGGSLAAGGLGMAGGAAVITGGGAILGMAGSGGASMATLLLQTNSDYWIRQCTKLITFCKCVLKDRFNDSDHVEKLLKEISLTISQVEKNIKELEDEKCTLDKEAIKESKEVLKYLNKSKAELVKIIKN